MLVQIGIYQFGYFRKLKTSKGEYLNNFRLTFCTVDLYSKALTDYVNELNYRQRWPPKLR